MAVVVRPWTLASLLCRDGARRVFTNQLEGFRGGEGYIHVRRALMEVLADIHNGAKQTGPIHKLERDVLQ